MTREKVVSELKGKLSPSMGFGYQEFGMVIEFKNHWTKTEITVYGEDLDITTKSGNMTIPFDIISAIDVSDKIQITTILEAI